VRLYDGTTVIETLNFDLSQSLQIKATDDQFQGFDAIEVQAAPCDAVLALLGVDFKIVNSASPNLKVELG
jgi:hypothetical protein